MTKNNFFLIAITVLLIANTVLVSVLLLRKPKPHKQTMGKVFDFLVSELELDSNQIKQFTLLKQQQQNAVETNEQARRKAKDGLFKLLDEDSAADSIVDKYLDEIAASERQNDKNTFYHFKALRAICNKKQKQKFGEIIMDAMRKKGRQGPPPPPRHRNMDDRMPPDDSIPPPEEDKPLK